MLHDTDKILSIVYTALAITTQALLEKAAEGADEWEALVAIYEACLPVDITADLIPFLKQVMFVSLCL